MTQHFDQFESVSGSVPSLLGMAKGLREQKLPEEAFAICQQAFDLDPHSAQACLLMAACRRDQRRYREAISWGEKAVEIEDILPEAHALLAKLHLEMGDVDAAEASARTALRDAPRDDGATAILGAIALSRDDLKVAMRQFKAACKIAPDKWSYWFGLGMAQQAANQHKAAIESFYHVLDLNAALPHTHYRLGCIFLDLDRLNDARLAFQTAAELNPVGKLLQLVRAVTAIRRGAYAPAIELMQALMEMYPKSGLLHLVLGDAELAQQRYDAALAKFTQAVEFNPGLAAGYFKKGEALRSLDREAEASFEFGEALRRNPQHFAAQLELDELLLPELDAGLYDYQVVLDAS